jgi:hypothetical protein
MQWLIDLLRRVDPVLLILAAAWIFGILSRIVAGARNAAAKRRKMQQGSRPTARDPMQAGRAVRTRPAEPPPRPRPRAQPTQEEVAAEMRRILGLDPGAPPRRLEAAEEPAPPRPPRREPLAGDRPPEPLRTSTLGQLTVQVDPHVGGGILQRRAPISGSVGAQQLGMLGGRTRVLARGGRRGASPLVDLSNLPRAIVLREILDRPLGLRDLD